jgi:hypothetical protein
LTVKTGCYSRKPVLLTIPGQRGTPANGELMPAEIQDVNIH